MSEKEIIKNEKEMIDNAECWIDDEEYSGAEEREWAKFEKETIEGLLDLYNKEKEKNNSIESQRLRDMCYKNDGNYISKDKIKEKIKQLEKEQEQNSKELARGIDYLSKEMIEASSKKIEINLSIRKYLQELLEGDK